MGTSGRRRVDHQLILEAVRTADRPAQFLEILCKREGAVAGSYWRGENNPFGEDTFFLRAVFGRPNGEQLVGEESFHLDDDTLVAKDAFINRQPVLKRIAGTEFGRKWLAKAYTKDLVAMNLSEILAIPVFAPSGQPVALFSIYFVKRGRTNLMDLFRVCEIQAASMGNTERQIDEAALERSKSRHEILGHSRIIAEKLSEIKKNLLEVGEMPPDRETQIKKVEDAIRSARVLKLSFERGTFKERVRERKKYAVWINLTASLSNSLAAEVQRSDGRSPVLRGTIPKLEWQLEFYPDDLQILFSNLISNAFKYSTASSVIRAKIRSDERGLMVSLHNDVEIDRHDDVQSIWKYEYRGEYARASNIPGQGIGLGLVSEICDVYEIQSHAKYIQDPGKTNTKQFIVELTIPKSGYRHGDGAIV